MQQTQTTTTTTTKRDSRLYDCVLLSLSHAALSAALVQKIKSEISMLAPAPPSNIILTHSGSLPAVAAQSTATATTKLPKLQPKSKSSRTAYKTAHCQDHNPKSSRAAFQNPQESSDEVLGPVCIVSICVCVCMCVCVRVCVHSFCCRCVFRFPYWVCIPHIYDYSLRAGKSRRPTNDKRQTTSVEC